MVKIHCSRFGYLYSKGLYEKMQRVTSYIYIVNCYFFYSCVHAHSVTVIGEWSAGPRSAVALSSTLPRPCLHVTPHKAAGVWHKSLIANIYRWFNRAQCSELQLYEVTRTSENPSLTEGCKCVCCCNKFDHTYMQYIMPSHLIGKHCCWVLDTGDVRWHWHVK